MLDQGEDYNNWQIFIKT